MRIALAWAGAGIAIGVAGLYIDAALIFPSAGAAGAANPAGQSFVETFFSFWTYFTHLTNLWLVLCYLAYVTEWRWLGWLRRPTMLASAATFITLVMLFYHFMLAPYIRMEGELLVATYLLHYVAPLLYLGWWLFGAPHGRLTFGRIPLMLLPGVLYIGWVLLRGAVVNEYPYDILDVSKAGYGGVAVGVLALLVAVSLFAGLLVLADRWLGRRGRPSSA